MIYLAKGMNELADNDFIYMLRIPDLIKYFNRVLLSSHISLGVFEAKKS